MQILCPVNLGHPYAVIVSGTSRTLAANGRIDGVKVMPPAGRVVVEVRLIVRLGDLTGQPDPGLPSATDPLVKVVTPVGSTWCADDVPVLDWAASGSGAGSGGSVQLTLFAYGLDNQGHLVGMDLSPFAAQENSGDRCQGCSGSGASGSGVELYVIRGARREAAVLEATVPDGPQAGVYRATPSSTAAERPLSWLLSVGGIQYEIVHCAVRGLVVRLGGAEAVGVVEAEPFSATFPGALFGARGDVVVVLA